MSVGKEQVKVLNIDVTSGDGAGTVTNHWDIARWIRVIPISETSIYDLTFKDGEGDLILMRSCVGTFSEKVEYSMGILRTVLIENASEDGTYKVKFDLH